MFKRRNNEIDEFDEFDVLLEELNNDLLKSKSQQIILQERSKAYEEIKNDLLLEAAKRAAFYEERRKELNKLL